MYMFSSGGQTSDWEIKCLLPLKALPLSSMIDRLHRTGGAMAPRHRDLRIIYESGLAPEASLTSEASTASLASATPFPC